MKRKNLCLRKKTGTNFQDKEMIEREIGEWFQKKKILFIFRGDLSNRNLLHYG